LRELVIGLVLDRLERRRSVCRVGQGQPEPGVERHVVPEHSVLLRRGRLRVLSRRALAAVAASLCLAACGSAGSGQSEHRAFMAYLDRVEPIRLAVNRLLNEADPILSAYRDHRVTPEVANDRMSRLERRFASYEAQIAAVRPVPDAMQSSQRAYAHTYVLEDAYLRALAAALPARSFDSLPRTAGRQRATIAAWRIRLERTARRLGIRLPQDVQIAGRGEIAPSPTGS
jgi:hypothetical protein